MSNRAQPEGNIQDDIREVIANKLRWRHRRNNVHGPARCLGGGGLVRCGTTGEADLTVHVPYKFERDLFRILHVECKQPGEDQKDEQKVWQKLVEACGEYYVVCESVQDFRNYLTKQGWA